MHTRSVFVALSLITMISMSGVASAVTWQDRQVGVLQSVAGADCVFFTLVGVAEADPARPGDPWFSMPRSQSGAKDLYAMLLAAKLSGQAVTVQTTGSTSSSCAGYVSIAAAWIP